MPVSATPSPDLSFRYTAGRISGLAVALLALAGVGAYAQSANPINSEPVQLSRFEIVAEDDRSYQAANTLSSTRTNVPIRDLPMQINVVTEQFMADFALFDFNQVLDALPGTARSYDDFFPTANIRGFDSLTVTRNGVRVSSAPDMTSIARVEVIKGPAALIHGWAQPGGVINYVTKNPSSTRKATVRVSTGSDHLFRSELDATGPIDRAGTFNYRLGLSSYSVENGERERSKDRVVFAPMLQWKPFSSTSITVRYGNTHDDIRPADGLVQKPTGAINRGGDPSQFYPFNGLDAVQNPQWVTSVRPRFWRDSPSSYRDFKPVTWELEATQRLNSAMELRGNIAYSRRATSAIRENGTPAILVNPWTQAIPTIAQLNGYNSWNLDNTRGDPFPEAQFTYELAGRNGVPGTGSALADTRLLNGQPYVFNPAVRTLQYVDGITGWRRVAWTGGNRRDRRVNGQIDLVTQFRTGPLHHTLLTGFEHNDEHRWENNSALFRDPSLSGGAMYTIPGNGAQVPNRVDYWYNIFDPASTAARDAFARRNLPPLSGFTSSGASDDRGHVANAFYANWSATFLEHRGRLALGGRYDSATARLSTRLATNAIGLDGPGLTRQEGTNSRATPQAGLSFRIADSVTLYGLYSQSVNPVTTFQPFRATGLETLLRTRYQQDGLPAPNLDAMPWGEYLAPEFGQGIEHGVKTEFFAGKAMVNIASFVIERKNISRLKLDPDPDSVAGFRELTGAQRARGIDIDFYARPLRGLQLGGGVLYNQTKVVAANATTLPTPLAETFTATAGPAARYSVVGQPIINSPKWSGNGYLRYEFLEGARKGLALGVSYNHMGPRREENTLRWSEAWSRWDANVSYRRKVLQRATIFRLVVRNATDRIFRVDADAFAPRRQFVGSVSVEL